MGPVHSGSDYSKTTQKLISDARASWGAACCAPTEASSCDAQTIVDQSNPPIRRFIAQTSRDGEALAFPGVIAQVSTPRCI